MEEIKVINSNFYNIISSKYLCSSPKIQLSFINIEINNYFNKMVERQNRTIAAMISAYVNETGTDWDKYVKTVAFAYNTSVQKSIKFTPFFVNHCREAILPIDLALVTENNQFSINNYFNKSSFTTSFKRLVNDNVNIVEILPLDSLKNMRIFLELIHIFYEENFFIYFEKIKHLFTNNTLLIFKLNASYFQINFNKLFSTLAVNSKIFYLYVQDKSFNCLNEETKETIIMFLENNVEFGLKNAFF